MAGGRQSARTPDLRPGRNCGGWVRPVRNIKYYLLALIIIVIGEAVSTAMQLLGGYLPTNHPAAILATNLSGITFGGIIMVIAFLKDNRLDQERKNTKQEQERAAQEQERAAQERERATLERERADRLQEALNAALQQSADAARERERADRLQDELNAARQQYADPVRERERADRLQDELNAVHRQYADALIKRLQQMDAGNGSSPKPD